MTRRSAHKIYPSSLEENDDEKDKKNAVDVETLHEWDSRVRKELFSPRTPLIPFSYITHRN